MCPPEEQAEPHSQDAAWLGKHIGSLPRKMLFRVPSHLNLPRTLGDRGVPRCETLMAKNRKVSGILPANWRSEAHRNRLSWVSGTSWHMGRGVSLHVRERVHERGCV